MKQLTKNHLTLFRSHFGLTQAKAASLVGVTRVTWARWETGHNIPIHLTATIKMVSEELQTNKTTP